MTVPSLPPPPKLTQGVQYAQMESVGEEADSIGQLGGHGGRGGRLPLPTREKKPQNVMNSVFLAHSLLRRRKFDECLRVCEEQLAINALDEAVWFIKTRCLTEKNYLDDTEMEEEGVADMLLDSNAMQSAARPGNSPYTYNHIYSIF